MLEEPWTAPSLPAAVSDLARHLPAGRDAWLVGGAVRDLLLGRPLKDIDLAVAGDGLEVARHLANALGGAWVPLDRERGVARVVLDEGSEIDVADFRAPSLEADLLARDFSCNAMALTLAPPHSLVDPAAGRRDLAAHCVRLLRRQALDDDPLRGLRGVRLAAQLGFALDPQSARWIADHAAQLATVSSERIRDELVKTLLAPGPADSLQRLADLGLLAVALPETARIAEGRDAVPWQRLLRVIECTDDLCHRLLAEDAAGEIPPDLLPFRNPLATRLVECLAGGRPRHLLILLGALFPASGESLQEAPSVGPVLASETAAEVAAQSARDRLTSLRFARDEASWVANLVRYTRLPLALAGPAPTSRREQHRFHRTTGETAAECCLLARAHAMAAHLETRAPSFWQELVARSVELLAAGFLHFDSIVAPPQLITGKDLIAELGMAPGRKMGEILDAIREAQAAGEVTQRPQALAVARRLATD